jgi:ferrochelatase
MEIIYDLDTQARQLCEGIGLNMVRAATLGTHPAFIRMIRELILERMNPDGNRSFLGTRGASHDVCFPSCCLSEVSEDVAKVDGRKLSPIE